MAKQFPKPPDYVHDGTSQAERMRPALAPGYVNVDELTSRDILAFARSFARELKFFDTQNHHSGDWSGLFASIADLDQAVDFMNHPDKYNPEKHPELFRPHFVLLLTFLKLLEYSRQHMNTLTRRHLDFYYRDILGLQKSKAVPDSVNVLIEPTRKAKPFRLPAGTALDAGPDSKGKQRIYQTVRDIIVNQAKIEQLRSVFVQKKVTGILDARELHKGPADEKFLRMLEISHGDPKPGDPLPPYAKGQRVDVDFLRDRADLIQFTKTDLYMDLFELRQLMQLKKQRDVSQEEWKAINAYLEKAGRRRDPEFSFKSIIPPIDHRNFDKNLALAMGGAPDFGGITEVENINDLYEQRNRSDVKNFIREKLYFDPVEDFFSMMQIKVPIDKQWEEINRILETAGRKKDASFQFRPNFVATDFQANLALALAPDWSKTDGIDTIDAYYAAVLAVERYMCMSAENFSYLMSIAGKGAAQDDEWHNVYELLADAYRERIYKQRRDSLVEVREDQGFNALIQTVLGDAIDTGQDVNLDRLKEYKIGDVDFDFIKTVHEADRANKKVTVEQWDRAYRILEMVWRVRENLPEPEAYKEELLNLYPFADATMVIAKKDSKDRVEQSPWKTFGESIVSAGPDNPPQPVIGWAVSSPQLLLSQGERSVVLTLGFIDRQFNQEQLDPFFPETPVTIGADQGPFRLEVSTSKGWIQPVEMKVARGRYEHMVEDSKADAALQRMPALQFSFVLGEEVDALAPLPHDSASIASAWPILRLMLRQMWNQDNAQHVMQLAPFEDLQFAIVHLKTEVAGLSELTLRNDETVVEAGKPFEPFGLRPAAGSRFYLGHAELNTKLLDNLQFNFQWMGVPENIQEHYANYGIDFSTTSFATRISLVDKMVDLPLDNSASLFVDLKKTTDYQHILIEDLKSVLKQNQKAFTYTRTLNVPADKDPLVWQRHLVWELNHPDFQHSTYPALVTANSVELAAEIAKTPNTVVASKYKLNPPYTPKLKSFSVDYTSSLEISVDQYRHHADADRFFHIHPFGYNQIQADPDTNSCHFLPPYDYEGELYIGLKNVQSPQQVSILFQMADGSGDPDLTPESVHWSYLDENDWYNMNEGNILFDASRGLINSGIIEFDLPAARPGTRMPTGLYWIRAAVSKNSRSICDTLAVHTQAVMASLNGQDVASDHYQTPLSPGRIKRTLKPLSNISAIQQPYTSFGGKGEEKDNVFYRRVSERLRHKQRALTAWDYEHLILEKFPQLYKVKCIPAHTIDKTADVGRVDIIVITDVRNQTPFDPFEPKAPADLIENIRSFLVDKVSGWAVPVVRNAIFLPVRIRIGVRFKEGLDEGYFKLKLNEDLNRYLSPWAYDEGADIVIGGRIFANSIVNFIDRQDYIDYVAGIKLFINRDGIRFEPVQPVEGEGYFVGTERPDAVLVAAQQHDFDIISDVDYDQEQFTGINYMKIELDFIVG